MAAPHPSNFNVVAPSGVGGWGDPRANSSSVFTLTVPAHYAKVSKCLLHIEIDMPVMSVGMGLSMQFGRVKFQRVH